MKFGYARVSTSEQNLDLQIDALKTLGCDRIFQETISSRRADRLELRKRLAEPAYLRMMATVRLDRG